MSEIVLPIIMGIFRFFIGLYELFGFLIEADFWLTDGLFSARTLLAVRNKLKRRRGVSIPHRPA